MYLPQVAKIGYLRRFYGASRGRLGGYTGRIFAKKGENRGSFLCYLKIIKKICKNAEKLSKKS